jgi:hypothetical protein
LNFVFLSKEKASSCGLVVALVPFLCLVAIGFPVPVPAGHQKLHLYDFLVDDLVEGEGDLVAVEEDCWLGESEEA